MSYQKYFNFIDDQIGLQLASVALLILALIPIFVGSISSLNTMKQPQQHHSSAKTTRKNQHITRSNPLIDHEDEDDNDESVQVLTTKDAILLPVIGSVLLYTVYLTLNAVSPQYIDKSIQVITSILSCTVLSNAVMMVLNNKLPSKCTKSLEKYKVSVSTKNQKLCHINVTAIHMSVLVASIALVVAYSITEHWVIGNIFATSLAISCIGAFTVDSFMTGFFLLSGMLAYDIFWLFGTDVLLNISDALSYAPTTIVWPRNINTYVFEKLLKSNQYFTSFGLGDIIIPGIYIAYCLRFDRLNSWKKSSEGEFTTLTVKFSKPYYSAAIFAYTVAAATSIYIVHYTKTTQSALLFIVPSLIASTVGTAIVRNEMGSLSVGHDILTTFSKLSSFSADDEEERHSRFPKRSTATSSSSKRSTSTTRGRSSSRGGRSSSRGGRGKSKTSVSKSSDTVKDTVNKAKETAVKKAKEVVPKNVQDTIENTVEDTVEQAEDLVEQVVEATTPKTTDRKKRSSSRVSKKK